MGENELIIRYVALSDKLEAALAGLAEAGFDQSRSSEAGGIRQNVHSSTFTLPLPLTPTPTPTRC